MQGGSRHFNDIKIRYIRFFTAEVKPMRTLKISANALRFWSFMLALFSSVSTAVFSESAFHDNFALAVMAIALAGMIVSAAFLMLDAVLAVCNP